MTDHQAKALEAWLNLIVTDYSDRILAFDTDCAQVWGRLMAPNPHHPIDKQIAAIAPDSWAGGGDEEYRGFCWYRRGGQRSVCLGRQYSDSTLTACQASAITGASNVILTGCEDVPKAEAGQSKTYEPKHSGERAVRL